MTVSGKFKEQALPPENSASSRYAIENKSTSTAGKIQLLLGREINLESKPEPWDPKWELWMVTSIANKMDPWESLAC